ncbi:MAG: TadE/TadG family type IV pilus assembly protein [Xanthobacteraceae bacterium]|jgi:Flp pilus assembly protein TadG
MLKESIRFGARFARIRALISDFRSDKRANTAIIFALASLPLISAVGCVVDYSTASMIKTKLQAASDAAALATVSNNSPIITTAKNMSGNGTVTGGQTYAQNFFIADTTAFSGVTYSASVTKTGTTLTANVTFSYPVPTFFMGIMGYKTITVSGSSTASYSLPTYISFYLMLDVSGSMSFPSTAAEQVRLMAVNPDNLHPSNSPPNGGYPQGCQFACHWATQNTTCQQTEAQTGSFGPWQGSWPPSVQQYGGTGLAITSQWPSGYPGGYCLGFLISRLGTTPVAPINCVPANDTPPPVNTNDSSPLPAAPSGKIPGTNTFYPSGCGQYVNWTNPQASSCPNPGTTSCIQLQADAVGYAVTALLQQAQDQEGRTGISNEFSVGLYPFIVNLCTASAGSSNSCSVGQTTSLGGSTITNFAQQLASLLDNGGVGSANSTLGSGGTHFENALSSMNSFITSSMIGTGGSASSTLPYVFIVTDGSQDYQTQSNGNWGSENWSSSSNVPWSNSATVLPAQPGSPNDQNSPAINTTNWCATMKNRGITIAILYIPYQPIQDPNSSFANDEDGYANANIPNIPTALQSCASPKFFYTATSPTAISNDLVAMFDQAVSTAHVSQ